MRPRSLKSRASRPRDLFGNIRLKGKEERGREEIGFSFRRDYGRDVENDYWFSGAWAAGI